MSIRAVKLPFKDKYIHQDMKGHLVTSDTQFLVNTVLHSDQLTTNDKLTVLEIGSGNGIIAIMLSLSNENLQLTAIEVQIPMYRLALENIKLSSAEVELYLADMRKPQLFLQNSKYDIIVSNPPYYKVGSGKLSANIEKNIGRFEFLADMNDLFYCIAYSLQPQGWAYILYPQQRYEEVLQNAEKHGLILHKRLPVNNEILNEYISEEERAKVADTDKTVFILRFKEIV